MSILSGLTTDNDIQEEKDSIGGSVLDTDVYDFKIDLAYLRIADSEAVGLVFNFSNPQGNYFNTTLWVQSGKNKGKKNYWVDKEGKKNYLPGFSQANAIAQLTVGKDLSELEAEEKVVNIYSYDAKKELPTKVNVLTELLNQPIKLGVLKQKIDKKIKDPTGSYVPSGETTEINELAKVFSGQEGYTITEMRSFNNGNSIEHPFIDRWVKKFKGTVKDKSTGSGSASATPVTKPATPASSTDSLFDD